MSPSLFLVRMSEATITAVRFVEARDLVENASDYRRNHQLGDAVPTLDHEGNAAGIQENDLYLTPIVGINGTRCVGNDDPVAQGEPKMPMPQP